RSPDRYRSRPSTQQTDDQGQQTPREALSIGQSARVLVSVCWSAGTEGKTPRAPRAKCRMKGMIFSRANSCSFVTCSGVSLSPGLAPQFANAYSAASLVTLSISTWNFFLSAVGATFANAC